jgi:hypothetical protein
LTRFFRKGNTVETVRHPDLAITADPTTRFEIAEAEEFPGLKTMKHLYNCFYEMAQFAPNAKNHCGRSISEAILQDFKRF